MGYESRLFLGTAFSPTEDYPGMTVAYYGDDAKEKYLEATHFSHTTIFDGIEPTTCSPRDGSEPFKVWEIPDTHWFQVSASIDLGKGLGYVDGGLDRWHDPAAPLVGVFYQSGDISEVEDPYQDRLRAIPLDDAIEVVLNLISWRGMEGYRSATDVAALDMMRAFQRFAPPHPERQWRVVHYGY